MITQERNDRVIELTGRKGPFPHQGSLRSAGELVELNAEGKEMNGAGSERFVI